MENLEEEQHNSSDDGMTDEMDDANNNDVFNDDEIEALIAAEEWRGRAQNRSKKTPKTVQFRYGTSKHFFFSLEIDQS